MKNFKMFKLGKNSKFKLKDRGTAYEHVSGQFQLKAENRGLYERSSIGNPVYDNNYSMYVTNIAIEKGGYNYIEYIGNHLSFNEAYEYALLKFHMKYGVNIFIYNGFCYRLDKKYRNPKTRGVFKPMSENTKYVKGRTKKVKRGLEKSQSLTNKILGIKGY